jgi:hypothetical protein
MMKIALSGASGFVASAIKQKFPDFVVINRNDTPSSIKEKLVDVQVVVNLAGAPIIKRWSEEYKKILYSSRIQTTQKLVNAINESDVEYFISTSAVGIYPDNMVCDETCEIGSDFLGMLAKAWEEEAFKCNKPTAVLRFGIVLGKDGGALAQMLTPFKLGVGGIIGDGAMMMSWIDIEDLARIYEFLIEKRVHGVFNATAPKPVSNYEFTKTLGATLQRPTIFPLPEFVLKLIFGEAATVLTGSKEIYPKALQEAGFDFLYPDIKSSLNHLLKS